MYNLLLGQSIFLIKEEHSWAVHHHMVTDAASNNNPVGNFNHELMGYWLGWCKGHRLDQQQLKIFSTPSQLTSTLPPSTPSLHPSIHPLHPPPPLPPSTHTHTCHMHSCYSLWSYQHRCPAARWIVSLWLALTCCNVFERDSGSPH